MSRRRKKNPLLTRIILISVGVHVIALPILAHYGAFKKIQQSFMQTQMVVLPPPEQDKTKEETKKAKAAPKAKVAAKSNGPAHQNTGPKSNLNQPKVVASNSPAGSGDSSGEPTVDANGSGKAGQLPTTKNDGNGTGTDTKPDTTPKTEPKTEPKVEPKTEPKVEPKTEPKVEPKKPVYADAEVVTNPEPTIPDDLRADALDKVFVAEFVVGPDGLPVKIKTAQSTGISELDQIALDAAKRWRFKPATKDGEPIEQVVRLRIEFKVD